MHRNDFAGHWRGQAAGVLDIFVTGVGQQIMQHQRRAVSVLEHLELFALDHDRTRNACRTQRQVDVVDAGDLAGTIDPPRRHHRLTDRERLSAAVAHQRDAVAGLAIEHRERTPVLP